MKLSELEALINEAESIQKFAEDNLLKLAWKDNLYILNYDDYRLGTEKNWISHYCRGLTLHGTPKNYTIVAKAFDRFYNIQESPEYLGGKSIDFTKPFEVQFKYDGSLFIEYYNRKIGYQYQTRGSFAEGIVDKDFYPKPFIDLYKEARMTIDDVVILQEGEAAVFELCSPHNQVVEKYEDTFAVLLAVINIDGTEREGVYSGISYNASSLDDVFKLLQELKSTQEGFVIAQYDPVEKKYFRVKCKTETWVELSHFNNGGVQTDTRLWNVVLKREIDEVIAVFPKLKDRLTELDKEYRETMDYAKRLWNDTYPIESQKEFAMAVKDEKFSGAMFEMRKGGDFIDCMHKYFRSK